MSDTPRMDSCMKEFNDCTAELYQEGCKLEHELAEAKASHLELLQSHTAIKHQLTAHKSALEKCEEILDMTIRDQPACDGGSLYYEHYDGEGNYTGSESIDPIGAYGRLLGEITKALYEIAKLKGVQ